MATLLFQRIDRVLVIYHALRDPSDAEWDACMQFAARELPNYDGMLIYSDGGGPNSAQRQRMAREKFNHIPTVVMTDSMLVRGIMSAMSWLGRSSRGVRRDQMAEAVAFLKLTPNVRGQVEDALENQRRQLKTKVA